MAAAIAALFVVSGTADAAEWKITPHLFAGETYTDNVSLAPTGLEKSDFITQINPGASIAGTGGRLRVNADYTLQNLIYAHTDRNTISNHLLNATANAELAENLAFIDARATSTQQNTTLLAPQASDNINTAQNRADITTTQVSPYLRHNLGTSAIYELRYTHNTLNASGANSTALSNSQADRVNLSLNSGPSFGTVRWGANYSKEKVNYTRYQDTDSEVYTGNLTYLVNPRFNVIGVLGREKNNYLFSGTKPEGAFWSAGFSWRPTERTDLSASVGKRFYGNTYALKFDHRTRMTVWSVDYSQDITTSRSQFFLPVTMDTAGLLDSMFKPFVSDPVLRAQAVQAYMLQHNLSATIPAALNFFSSQTFLQKRLQASVALNGAVNTVILSGFNTLREAQLTGTTLFGSNDFASSTRIKQYGANVMWNWRFAPRTSANLNYSYTHSQFLDIGREDDMQIWRVGLSHQIQQKMVGTVECRMQKRDFNQGQPDYDEHAITATLGMTF